MKKILLSSIIIIFALSFIIYGAHKFRKPESMTELLNQNYDKSRVISMSDYMQYDYEPLFERATTVAIVTPIDNLSVNDRHGIGDDAAGVVSVAYSTRDVKVLKYYKNEHNYADTFTMGERCILSDDGTLLYDEGCYPLMKGDTYLVFLTKARFADIPFTLSVDNGFVDLTHLSINSRKDIAIKSVIDLFKSDLSDDAKESILKGEVVSEDKVLTKATNFETHTDVQSTIIRTGYEEKGYEMVITYTRQNNEWYFKIGDNCYLSTSINDE